MRRFISHSLVLGLSCVAVGAAEGAQTSSTTGVLIGIARYEGPAPPSATIHAHVNANICGAKSPMIREDLLVTADGALANVAVFLESSTELETGTQPKSGRLDQKNCTFVPHLQTLTVGSDLVIGNSDRVIHNVHAMSRGRTVFNLAMPRRGIELRRKVPETGVVRMQCDSGHDWMSAYVVVVPHAFHASSDAAGRFRISGIPPGEHRVRAWHEVLGALEGKVTVVAGEAARLDLTYRRSADLAKGSDPGGAEMKKKIAAVEEALSSELEDAKTALAEINLSLISERRKSVSAEARPLYLQHCATCHGRHGNGGGPSRKFLSMMARDFTRGEYKFRMTPSGAPPNVEDVFRTISLGVAGTEMPPWKDVLTKRQRRLLAQFVLTFAEFDEEERMDPITIGDPPTPTPEGLDRGKALYVELQCGQCHGTEGRGDGPSVATMKDAWGHSIRPADLTKPIFKGGAGPKVVYRTVMTGLSGSPMPSFGDLLEEDDRWALVFYVMSLSEGRSVLDYLFGDPAGRMTTP